jgi:hypothetical protein
VTAPESPSVIISPPWAPAEAKASVLAQALLLAVQNLGGSRPGSYTVTARLHTDGSWNYDWHWLPRSPSRGSAAGSDADWAGSGFGRGDKQETAGGVS